MTLLKLSKLIIQPRQMNGRGVYSPSGITRPELSTKDKVKPKL